MYYYIRRTSLLRGSSLRCSVALKSVYCCFEIRSLVTMKLMKLKKQMKRQQFNILKRRKFKKFNYLKYNPKNNPQQLRTRMLLENQNNLTQAQYKARHYQEN